MRNRFLSVVLLAVEIFFGIGMATAPAFVSAATKAVTGGSTNWSNGSTTAEFYNTVIAAPGKWTVKPGTDSVEFFRNSPNTDKGYFAVSLQDAGKCTYESIRSGLVKIWGKQFDQKHAQFAPLTYGRNTRSSYRGYQWVEPANGGTHMWCTLQNATKAAFLKAPNADKDTVNLMNTVVLLQLTVRNAR